MTATATTTIDDAQPRRRSAPTVPVRSRTGRARGLTIACILDDFSFASFDGEADLVPLTMRDWHVELAAAQPDLLLVESAWRGDRGTWWNKVQYCGPEILGILQWCQERGIPTAFWNKEDPVHFGTFLDLASRFDAVFTTDIDCVPRYKARLGHERVHFLPFAAQLAAHNPLETFDRIDGCAFAGAYYAKYPDRTAALDDLSSSIAAAGRFDIYDRNHDAPHPDYAFPERYRAWIVGGLRPDEIDVAYKGYTTNLNLNSVQSSQSMFARRAFELMASNTLVLSNFSRGLRLMFGELALTVGSADELARRMSSLHALPNGSERLRHQALRKVVAEHTYAERLAYLAARCSIPLEAEAAAMPAIIAEVGSPEALEALLAAAARQTLAGWRLVLWGTGASAVAVADPRISSTASAEQALEAARAAGATHLGTWHADDWYGPDYLADLVSTLRWADVEAVGHVERWSERGGTLTRIDAGASWTPQVSIPLHRALVEIARVRELAPGTAYAGLAVGAIEYCEGGRSLDPAALEPASRIVLDEGLPLARLQAHADDLPVADAAESDLSIPLHRLLDGVASTDEISIGWGDDGAIEVSSRLEHGEHRFVSSTTTLGVDVLADGPAAIGHLSASPGLDVTLVADHLDASGTKLGRTMFPNAKDTAIAVPPGTASLRLGLRVSGPGRSSLERFERGRHRAPHRPLLLRSENLLVSNVYPSYDRLYRNAFVASRLRSYREHGIGVDVALLDGGDGAPTFREFRGVDVATIAADTLTMTLEQRRVRRLMIHFLERRVWDAVRAAPAPAAVTVWIHGFEIQPWHRRAYLYDSSESLDAAKRVSEAKMALWREVFESPPAGWHFVFVSRFLAEQSFEDVGVRLPEDRYSVVHNPVDTSLFAYREKHASDRYRVLSIRPYASSVYANDQAVAAVLRMRDRPDFASFRFAFYGDGPLFDEVTAPLRELDNVELHQRFLHQDEIAQLHREYGVFLTPSRMDTQGVSRGEAMASGLVPVASAVAAVPEFVDEHSGLLAPPEDVAAISAALGALADDPELFLRLSRGAAERVHRQVDAEVVIDQELRIAFRR